jgi:signal transduction histidine kinase
MRALRDVAARTAEAHTSDDVFTVAAETLADYRQDLPFVLFYALVESDAARLVSSTGIEPGTWATPAGLPLTGSDEPWPVAEVVRSAKAVLVTDLASRFTGLINGTYPEPPTQALVLPITPPGYGAPAAVMIAGLSPRLELNDTYRSYCDVLADSVTTALAKAHALEQERKRAEALADIDRAKTAFFSNVSHEFRTPLTLILGPLEELLASESEGVTERQRERLETVRHNAGRLQKLVNALLEFARAEAGRLQASFEPTDLAQLTTELASAFNSATQRAGLTLDVQCDPMPEPVYVDRDMWEKIVLNLLSNAFNSLFTARFGFLCAAPITKRSSKFGIAA